MDNEKIGLFIKKLREEKDFSQNDLAEIIPISREAISKWECGKTIPNSQTILRLCEIFNVTADEILFGEYKTKDNIKNMKEIHLQIYDERNTTKQKLKKYTKILMAFSIMLFVVIVIFLVYYFFNSYDSVKIYTIESKQDDIYLTDGIVMLTGENIYFKLGNINGIDDEQITKVSLYSKENETTKIIYESTSAKDFLIRDYYGYNEYFKIKGKKLYLENLYVDIFYKNEIKTINLIMKEDYSNKRLIFKKEKNISSKEIKEIKNENDLANKIKQNIKYEESGIYHQQMKIDSNEYDVYYIDELSKLLIYWKKDKFNYSIEYFLTSSDAYYKKSDKENNDVENCYYNEKNNKTTCDNSVIKVLSSIINGVSSW